jgi:hypothetical protein
VLTCREREPGLQRRSAESRALLPKLLDQHKLPGKGLGKRVPDDAWVGKLGDTIIRSKPADAAGAVAEALAEGFSPDAIGEAIALAANQLVLRDEGRPKNQTAANKPVGSIHGDSIGVHACDSANAWRNLARVANPRNTVACLILGAYQASKDRTDRTASPDDFLKWEPYPRPDHPKMKTDDRDALLKEAEDAIKNKDQVRAAAAIAGVRRCRPSASAGVRPAAALRDQRGRGAARREVLPHGDGGVRGDAGAVPLAAPGGTGPRDGERLRSARAGPRR